MTEVVSTVHKTTVVRYVTETGAELVSIFGLMPYIPQIGSHLRVEVKNITVKAIVKDVTLVINESDEGLVVVDLKVLKEG